MAKDKADSISETRNASEEIQIFADGSAIEGKVGAAAIMLKGSTVTNTLHFHLGPDTEHTVHEAELVGLTLGIHLINSEHKGRKSMAIGSDNQAALKAFHSNLRKPGHHLERETLRMANKAQNKGGQSAN